MKLLVTIYRIKLSFDHLQHFPFFFCSSLLTTVERIGKPRPPEIKSSQSLLFAKSSPATFIIPLVFYFTLAPLLLLVALNYTIPMFILLAGEKLTCGHISKYFWHILSCFCTCRKMVYSEFSGVIFCIGQLDLSIIL